MRQARVALTAALLAVTCLLAGVWVRGQGAGKYHAAGLAMAGDIAYPMSSRAPGFVTLDVSASGRCLQPVQSERRGTAGRIAAALHGRGGRGFSAGEGVEGDLYELSVEHRSVWNDR